MLFGRKVVLLAITALFLIIIFPLRVYHHSVPIPTPKWPGFSANPSNVPTSLFAPAHSKTVSHPPKETPVHPSKSPLASPDPKTPLPRALSRDQCIDQFPNLFNSLDHMVAKYRREGRRVTMEDVNIGQGRCMMQVMIHDHEVYMVDPGSPKDCYILNPRERVIGMLGLIQNAVQTSPEPIPNIEFPLSFDDLPFRSREGIQWAFTRNKGDNRQTANLWLVPDYGFWAWSAVGSRINPHDKFKHQEPHATAVKREEKEDEETEAANEKEKKQEENKSEERRSGKSADIAGVDIYDSSWAMARRRINVVNAGTPFAKKIDKAVWRGLVEVSPAIRQTLLDKVGDAPWGDVDQITDETRTEKGIGIEDFCRYKFVIHTEGTSYSGRLKYHLLCDSVVIAHPLEWEEFQSHLMTSAPGHDQNYIQTEKDWADLGRKMEASLMGEGAKRADRIRQAAWKTFAGPRGVLSDAGLHCYLRHLMWAWSQVQDFEPQLYTTSMEKQLRGEMDGPTLRGIPVEVFLDRFDWSGTVA